MPAWASADQGKLSIDAYYQRDGHLHAPEDGEIGASNPCFLGYHVLG